MDLPKIFTFDSGNELEAAAELARVVASLGVESPYVLHSEHGELLARDLEVARPPERNVAAADKEWASDLGSRARHAEADAIVAIGGGRCIDVAKLAGARAGMVVIAVPTQPSHDGICSPVAVVPNSEGRTESIGAIAPGAVFVSIPTLMRAPIDSVRAGLGDLLANPFALRDWTLAAEHGLEKIDKRAWDLSVRSFELVKPVFESELSVADMRLDFLWRLTEALILSGMAMIYAGSSRPASGGEHEISHAIDQLYGVRGHHGAQVAFGCIISSALYGQNIDAFRERLRRMGLPDRPEALGLTRRDVVRVILHAPETRPGRFTILEDADLDEVTASTLVKQLWGEA